MAIRNDLIQSRSAYIGSSSSVSPSVGNLVVDGNVGIGTSSPSYKLDLRSPLNTDTFAFVSGGPGLTKGGIYLGNDGTQYSSLWFDNATNDFVIRQNYSSGNLILGTASTEKMRITSAGNVGIGTTNPTYGFVVNRQSTSLSATGTMYIGASLNGGGKGLVIDSTTRTDADAAVLALQIISRTGSTTLGATVGGNVGIGTTSPGDKLDVSGNIGIGNAGNKLYNGSSNDSAGLFFNSNVTNISGYSGINFRSSTTNVSSQTIRMFIQNDGNVGIGTTSPSSKLEIRGAQSASKSSLLLLSKFDYGTTTFFQNYSNTFYANGKSLEIEVETLPMLQLATNNAATEGKVIFPNGNVGVGTTNPASKLHINNSSAISTTFLAGNINGGAYFGWDSDNTGLVATYTNAAIKFGGAYYSSFNEWMRITSAGNVGIGTTSPNVSGYSRALTISSSDSGIELTSASNVVQATIGANTNGLAISGIGTFGVRIFTSASGATSERMRIAANGNVGIGTSSPGYKLDVTGDARFGDGNNFNPLIQFAGSGRVATSPGYSFVGDLDTGMFNPNLGNTLAFSTAGAERMRITADGNVGIGTSSPNDFGGSFRVLDVKGNTGGYILSTNSDNSTIAQMGVGSNISYYGTRTNADVVITTNNTERMRITTTGNLLVGTTTNLGADINANSSIRVGVAFGTKASIILGDSGTPYWEIFRPASSGNLRISSYALNAVEIQPTTGNVGIGTTNPYSPLQVGSYTGSGGFSYGTAATFVSSFNSARATLFVGSTDTTSTQDKGGSIDFGGGSEAGSTPYTYARIKGYKEVAGGGYSGYLSFSTTPAGSDVNTERMRINSSGQVLIGTTTAQSGTRLQVAGVLDVWSSSNTLLRFAHDSTKGIIESFTGGGYANTVINPNLGNVGIGTSSPSYKLDLRSPLNTDTFAFVSGGPGLTKGGIYLGNDGTQYSSLWFDNATNDLVISQNYSSGNLILGTASTEKMRITSAGNVGIGTTNPTYGFVVNRQSTSLSATGTMYIGASLNGGGKGLVIDSTTRTDADSAVLALQIISRTGNTTLGATVGGNVGIGTTSPGYKLEVNGNIYANGDIRSQGIFRDYQGEALLQTTPSAVTELGSTGAGTPRTLAFLAGNTERMRITTAGNVGIGTTSPTFPLSVQGIAQARGGVYVTQASPTNTLILDADNTSLHKIYTNSSVDLSLGTNNSTSQLYLKNGGNVGIGTTSPNDFGGSFRVLDVKGNTGGYILSTNSDNSTIAQMGVGSNISYYGTRTNADVVITTNNTEKMRITSAGNVGIGSPNPANYSGYTTLEVAASTGGVFRLKNNAESGVFEMAAISANTYIKNVTSTPMWFGTANTERMRITSAGNVGINTTTPGSLLTVEQDYTTTAEFGAFGQFSINGKTNTNKKLAIGFNTATDVGFIQAMENGVSYKNLLLNARGGNVGIGTTSPQNKFVVSNGGNIGVEIAPDYLGESYIISFNRSSSSYVPMNFDATEIKFKSAYGSGIAEAMRIAAGGNVGIGTTTPGAKLHVVGNTYIESGNLFVDTIAGYATNVVSIAANTNFYVPSGNVGIGTTSPSQKLHVVGSRILVEDTNAGIMFRTGGTNRYSVASTGGEFLIYDEVNSTSRLYITSAGNVGIGTTSPSGNLQVLGSSPIVPAIFNLTHFAGVGSPLDFTLSADAFGNGGISLSLSTNLTFSIAGSERMRITSSGSVGVGTSAPAASAIMHLSSTTKGFLPPQMKNSEMNAIASPATGLVVYDITNNKLTVYNGSSWVPLH